MAEIVNSLFGVDPESIRQARDTAIQERAMQYAKMDPFQRATAGLYSGVSRLGDSIGGMLGGVDPQLQKSSELKQLASQFDTTSAQGLQEYARALASRGFNQEALQVANAAQGFLGKQAATAKDVAAAARERQAAIPSDVLKAQREAALKQGIRGLGTDESPEAVQTRKTLQDELDALTRVKAPENKIQEVGVAVGTNKPVYTYQTATGVQQIVFDTDPATGQQVMKPYVGGVDRTTAKVSATASTIGENEFSKKLGGGQADKLLTSQATAEDSVKILETNKTARQLLDQGAITGTGADFLVSLNSGLKQAGIDFGYADAAANSQAYTAALGANVGRIIKQFGSGTGLSDADRNYAEQMAAGRIAITEKAIRKILDINDRAALSAIKQHNKAAAGVKSVIPLTVEVPTTPAKALSNDEQARAWVNANPTDPRAAAIKQRLGM